MNILIFDMDGVLLKPQGYHRALRETVRLAGIATGFGEVLLSDEHIARFEALGISSEWHSSALCMAVMELQKQDGEFGGKHLSQPVELKLEELFGGIAAQPLQEPALKRGLVAVEQLALKYGLTAEPAVELMANSESIHHSPTMNWFQELILGSELFKTSYQKEPQFQQESYLLLYDQRRISEPTAEKLLRWAEQSEYGAAIMTNRPSSGPPGFKGEPDAEMGTALVGLASLPLIGFGEITWLAEATGCDVGVLSKPGWPHALAAILVASGWSLEESLGYVREEISAPSRDELTHLQDSTVTVFEDTPGGLVAVQEAGELLNKKGLRVEVRKVGIAEDETKQTALLTRGADVYPDINQALADVDSFSTFPDG
jgi:phosphoglycolate phosphatase-like HAD superfamily hydrolase